MWDSNSRVSWFVRQVTARRGKGTAKLLAYEGYPRSIEPRPGLAKAQRIRVEGCWFAGPEGAVEPLKKPVPAHRIGHAHPTLHSSGNRSGQDEVFGRVASGVPGRDCDALHGNQTAEPVA